MKVLPRTEPRTCLIPNINAEKSYTRTPYNPESYTRNQYNPESYTRNQYNPESYTREIHQNPVEP